MNKVFRSVRIRPDRPCPWTLHRGAIRSRHNCTGRRHPRPVPGRCLVDLSGLTYDLKNGVPANSLGGFGSAIAYASGNTFLALPDRGPNAVEFDDAIDNTASYVNRFHTITMNLQPNTSSTGLPFYIDSHLA